MFCSFKRFRSGLVFGGGLVALFLMQMCRIMPIIGSTHSFFSLSDALMPITGALGIWMGIAATLVRSGLTFSGASYSLFSLVYHLPGFCASVSWAWPNRFIRCFLPVLCMVLFWVHPIGFYAAPYALYWLIPVGIFLLKKQGIFFEALSATFIAHAVGSVIWLYLKALPVAVWWSLIPVVPFERLLNATLMTMVYYGVCEVGKVIRFFRLSWRLRVESMAKN